MRNPLEGDVPTCDGGVWGGVVHEMTKLTIKSRVTRCHWAWVIVSPHNIQGWIFQFIKEKKKKVH